jgi:hypothetical protein
MNPQLENLNQSNADSVDFYNNYLREAAESEALRRKIAENNRKIQEQYEVNEVRRQTKQFAGDENAGEAGNERSSRTQEQTAQTADNSVLSEDAVYAENVRALGLAVVPMRQLSYRATQKAYAKLLMQYHPDHNQGKSAAE